MQGMKRPVIKYTEERRLSDACYPLVATMFHGVPLVVKIRELTGAQLYGIGNFSMVETFQDKIRRKQKPTIEEMNAYAERLHKIVKMALVSPTYDKLMEIAGVHIDDKEIDARLEAIKEKFRQLPEGKEKTKLKKEYETLELACKFILPGDFLGPIVEYLTGATRTDIKRVTEDMLYQWAILASRGHDNPADHAVGNFKRWPDNSPQAELYGPDTMLYEDINNRAWIIYDQKHPVKKA